jgi:SAM-dependent methyltransferase
MANGFSQTVSSIGSLLPKHPPACGENLEAAPRETAADYGQLTAFAVELGRERLFPTPRNPDYLVLNERRRHFSEWVRRVPGTHLSVLDVGGRIQPYRPLVESRLKRYIAIDPLPTGLVDAVAVGEQLPFADESFDLVFCSQVLCYAEEPGKVVSEIYRVLRAGGTLLVSAPALFPSHAPKDNWRFIPQRMLNLLSSFSDVEVRPEGYSIAGIFRILATFLHFSAKGRFLQQLSNSLLIPLTNRLGQRLDRFSGADTRFTTNYCAYARK